MRDRDVRIRGDSFPPCTREREHGKGSSDQGHRRNRPRSIGRWNHERRSGIFAVGAVRKPDCCHLDPRLGSQFLLPHDVKTGRELAARGFAFIAANTRMHDLGTVAAGVQEGKSGSAAEHTGVGTASKRVTLPRGSPCQRPRVKKVVLAGHSARTTAVQTYQAEKQDSRVVGFVLASGRFRARYDSTDQEVLEQATHW